MGSLQKLPITARESSELSGFLFRAGMWWRIFYGVLRITLGFALLRLIGTPVADIFYAILSHEIIVDPTDFLIRTVRPILDHLSFTVTYFLAIYMFFWGFIDIFLSINLLRHRLWAFPVSIFLIGIFGFYEIYRYSYTHSFVLLWVIFVDFVLIWLIWKEYRKLSPAPDKTQ